MEQQETVIWIELFDWLQTAKMTPGEVREAVRAYMQDDKQEVLPLGALNTPPGETL